MALNALLPLLSENAHSPAMIRHSMGLVQKAVKHLNPGQTPVVTFDQPMFTIAKEIQWKYPDSHGEDIFVIMFGGLHIEMAALKALGSWLDGSGWTKALAEAKVASPGTADSFIRASHVTKTRRAHTVTAAALYNLLKCAFDDYNKSISTDEDRLDFEDWHTKCMTESPQFEYWYTTLSFELTLLLFIRSLRQGNFKLYIEALISLVPWFFALDYTNYSRWIPVHIRDMLSLPTTHPAVFQQFMSGSFVVQKTHNLFSSLSIDHAHEQNNAGPEVARIVEEFEASCAKEKSVRNQKPRHHEQVPFAQKEFKADVDALVEVIENFGNPFKEESADLLVLDTKEMASLEVKHSVRKALETGRTQFDDFFRQRLVNNKKPINDPIPRNKFAMFSTPARTSVKCRSDRSLFSRLYISCQTRDGNLEEFFKHENQAFPPSISQEGEIRTGTKSDLLQCLESLQAIKHTQPATECPEVEVKVLDGAVVIHTLQMGQVKTFEDYANEIFLKHIEFQLQDCKRLDVVWDTYQQDSLKAGARAKRGKDVRRRVIAGSTLPKNLNDFLRVEENKSELFAYLSHHLVSSYSGNKSLYITTEDKALCLPEADGSVDGISPCTQEETDTRLILHVQDAVKSGFKKVMIRTVDTDVVVLAVAYFSRLGTSELWIALGVGKHFRYVAGTCKGCLFTPVSCLYRV